MLLYKCHISARKMRNKNTTHKMMEQPLAGRHSKTEREQHFKVSISITDIEFNPLEEKSLFLLKASVARYCMHVIFMCCRLGKDLS